jgi:hypothetical protein
MNSSEHQERAEAHEARLLFRFYGPKMPAKSVGVRARSLFFFIFANMVIREDIYLTRNVILGDRPDVASATGTTARGTTRHDHVAAGPQEVRLPA